MKQKAGPALSGWWQSTGLRSKADGVNELGFGLKGRKNGAGALFEAVGESTAEDLGELGQEAPSCVT